MVVIHVSAVVVLIPMLSQALFIYVLLIAVFASPHQHSVIFTIFADFHAASPFSFIFDQHFPVCNGTEHRLAKHFVEHSTELPFQERFRILVPLNLLDVPFPHFARFAGGYI